MIITIDGPTASGKSTVAQALAQRLGVYYLNTGMLYRALAYLLVNTCGYTQDRLTDPSQEHILRCLDPKKLTYCYHPNGTIEITYEGTNITPYLKNSVMDQAASIVSANQQVRHHLLDFQRWFGTNHDIVAEGRDVGSVVFPQADYKFYLMASLEERARRWQADRERQGEHFTLEQSMEQVARRDTRDKERAVAPLMVPEGAIEVDSTGLTKEQTLAAMTDIIQKNG